MIRVEVVEGQDKGKKLESRADFLRIGRGDTADLAVSEWHVSGEHAAIVLAGDHYVVRDLQSTNGTRVLRGGEMLDVAKSTGREVALRDEDILLLGDAERPVRVQVRLEEDVDDARIVTVRRVTELGRLEADLGSDAQVLHALYDAQKEIAGTLEVDELVDVVAKRVFALVSRATHLTIALREDDDGPRRSARYVPIGTRVRSGRTSDAIAITRSVFRKVVQERAAVLAADARKDVGETASIMGAQIHSTIGVPLWQGDDIVGVLQVDNREGTGRLPRARSRRGGARSRSRPRRPSRTRVSTSACGSRRSASARRTRTSRSASRRAGRARSSARRRFDAAPLRAARQGRRHARHGAHRGRDRHRQGAHRRGRALPVAPQGQALRRAELRGLPENLLESELFGHKKGSVHRRDRRQEGPLRARRRRHAVPRRGGRDALLSLQAKLLRVLQEGEIRPVGHSDDHQARRRAHRGGDEPEPRERGRRGRFREDLYYRLKVFPIRVPPLRERREDVPLLAAHFLRKYSRSLGKPVAGFSQQAMELMMATSGRATCASSRTRCSAW
jgi:pSer/pThr/pTyr-binding forkhead associated (FHA) protein